ncbi:MAG TPA: hypothetical protein VD971_00750 [Phycisphaerales bacterium]|nr:hypothetical protein [Phycisphaerales bacterium]
MGTSSEVPLYLEDAADAPQFLLEMRLGAYPAGRPRTSIEWSQWTACKVDTGSNITVVPQGLFTDLSKRTGIQEFTDLVARDHRAREQDVTLASRKSEKVRAFEALLELRPHRRSSGPREAFSSLHTWGSAPITVRFFVNHPRAHCLLGTDVLRRLGGFRYEARLKSASIVVEPPPRRGQKDRPFSPAE